MDICKVKIEKSLAIVNTYSICVFVTIFNGNAFGLTAGETKNDITILMMQTATISGHVSSETGKPVSGISVQIQQRFYSANGTVSYSTIATAQTNDLGDYRAYWVNPGRYYISTAKGGGNIITLLGDAAIDFDNSVRRGMNNVSETYPQTFYPGVADISKASSVELEEGGVRWLPAGATRKASRGAQ